MFCWTSKVYTRNKWLSRSFNRLFLKFKTSWCQQTQLPHRVSVIWIETNAWYRSNARKHGWRYRNRRSNLQLLWHCCSCWFQTISNAVAKSCNSPQLEWNFKTVKNNRTTSNLNNMSKTNQRLLLKFLGNFYWRLSCGRLAPHRPKPPFPAPHTGWLTALSTTTMVLRLLWRRRCDIDVASWMLCLACRNKRCRQGRHLETPRGRVLFTTLNAAPVLGLGVCCSGGGVPDLFKALLRRRRSVFPAGGLVRFVAHKYVLICHICQYGKNSCMDLGLHAPLLLEL